MVLLALGLLGWVVETSAQTSPRPAITDRPAGGARQGEGLQDQTAQVRDRLTLGALLGLRWLTLGGELAALLAAGPWLRLPIPFALCMTVIAVAAIFNLLVGLGARTRRPTAEWELTLQMGFDIAQMSALLFLTGGILNPFSLLLIAPAAQAAATLKARYALAVGALATAAVALLTFWALPLPWLSGAPPSSLLYRLAEAVATVAGIAVTAGYTWRAASDAARMELALNITQTVLAREQRLSALGGLAAAAAHELGTPLATISVVAKEMARETPAGPMREDAELLVSQAERCREILRRLTEEPEVDDAVHARMTLLQFANEVIEPHVNADVRVEAVVAGPPGGRPPEIRRMPEVLHAMTSLVENAVDFARSEVLVRVRFDDAAISVEVRDDGPGFSSDVIGKLGQPYVTSRPGGEGSRSGHVGMGLGFFIAKTLLERTGAAVEFHNGKRGGAIIAARWTRAAIEAAQAPGGFELGATDFISIAEEDAKGT
jgi:two-component system sensor histidine kinase RegB